MDNDAFAAMSAAQYGTFTRRQLLDLGITEAGIRHRLESGLWRVELPSVYGLVGHRDSWRRRLWAAHLHAGPDSVLAHCTAARIQGSTKVPANTVELIRREAHGPSPAGVTWRRRIDVVDSDIVHLPGLPPMTTPERTTVDLAGIMSVTRLRLHVDEALAERRLDLHEVAMILDRIRRSGKRGVRKMAQVLDDLGPGADMPASQLERLGDGVLELAGLPTPLSEHPLPNHHGRVGFVDRCWTEAKLIVEYDGRRWHNRFQQALKDADRKLEAQHLGWETSTLLWEHATSAAERSAEILASVYRQRVELLAGRAS